MISDFYETYFQSYQNQTVNIDPLSFLAPLTHHLKKGSKILDIGSRVKITLKGETWRCHRPHPGKESKKYQVEEAREFLERVEVKP